MLTHYAVQPKPKDEDAIQKTLKDIGVRYTHRNDDLMAENVIQGQRLKHIRSEVSNIVWLSVYN